MIQRSLMAFFAIAGMVLTGNPSKAEIIENKSDKTINGFYGKLDLMLEMGR